MVKLLCLICSINVPELRGCYNPSLHVTGILPRAVNCLHFFEFTGYLAILLAFRGFNYFIRQD